ncbi:MAG TPA: tyrosine-type recombinase/integrase [Myxococcales bacterium]|nr:tyrosine-type recombinase/integrase [Myxococcales bacterium]
MRKKWAGGFIRKGVRWIDRSSGGVRHRFSTRKTTDAGAMEVLRAYELDPAGFFRRAGERTDLAQAVASYLKASAARNSPKHVRSQARGFEEWATFLAAHGATSLEEITPALAEEFIAWRRDGGRPKTVWVDGDKREVIRPVDVAAVNRDLAAMKALLTWGRDTELIPDGFDPLRRRPLLPEHHGVRPHRYVERRDVLKARAKLTPRWRDLVTLLYGTAFRYDSAARLELASVDVRRRVVRDPRPKGRRAVEVAVSAEVLAAAIRVAQRNATRGDRDAEGRSLHEAYPEDEAQQLGRRLTAACRAAGVDRFTAHDLRVSAATLLHRRGLPLRDLQDRLGHRSTATTERYVRASAGSSVRPPI